MVQRVLWLLILGSIWRDIHSQTMHSDFIGTYKIDKIYNDSTLYYDADDDSFMYHYPAKMYRILFGPDALKNEAYLRNQIQRGTQIMKTNAGAQRLYIISDTLMVLPLMGDNHKLMIDTVRYFRDDSLNTIYFLDTPRKTNYTELKIIGNKILSSGDIYNCVIWKKELD